MNDKADNVVVEGLRVSYKGSKSGFNWSIFRNVDSGEFNLIHKDNGWVLNYQINVRSLFIYPAAMSIFVGVYMGVNGGPWWVGIYAFCWLCGGNWVINFLRHGGVASEMASGIDEYILGKPESEDEKEKDESLKSWF